MISVEVFCDSEENCNTYLITKDEYAIIIDPANDVKKLNKYLEGKSLVAILLTHGHYDHFKTLEEILKMYDVNCYLQKRAKDKIFDLNISYAKAFGCNKIPSIDESRFIFVNDNDLIKISSFNIRVLYTPGHTDDSVCYIIDNLLFSGDTLFKKSVGRTDLATGNTFKLMQSLIKIKKLKQDYIIYPGHDDATSLVSEKNHNPYLNKIN